MIAILTENPVLFRMLTLEVERCGLALSTPEEATLLLVDLSAPAMLPTDCHAVTVGLGGNDAASPKMDHHLPLPYPTTELQLLLRRYCSGSTCATALSHLPGHALLNGQRIPLSPTEERLFLLLLEHRGEPVSAEALRALLPADGSTSNLLQVLIYRLRQKLSPDGVSRIRSLRNVGYILIDEARSQ